MDHGTRAWHHFHHHRAAAQLVALGGLLLALTLVATALAAGSFKSGTYKGTLAAPRTGYTVSLKLSGTKLRPIKLNNIPFYCSGGGPPIPFTFPSTKISSAGAFTVSANNKIRVGPLKGQIGEKLTISGKFTKAGKVRGKLKTVYPKAKQCTGTSSFSAKR
ncbi:MAG: hypothetical protein ACRDNK_17670 [Solirubrobacteraceae bacterium]